MDLLQVAHKRSIFSESAEKMSICVGWKQKRGKFREKAVEATHTMRKNLITASLSYARFFGSLPSFNIDKKKVKRK